MQITIAGRDLLEKLKREAESKTSLGLIKQNRFAAYKWIFSTLGGGVIGYLLNDLLKWMFSN